MAPGLDPTPRDPEAPLPPVLDHYSLPAPSSALRFRHGTDRVSVRVYDQRGRQVLLEEHAPGAPCRATRIWGHEEAARPAFPDGRSITVKEATSATYGLLFLRGWCALLAAFLTGFVFIFSVGLLLFLVADLGDEARGGLSPGFLPSFFGTLLSLPLFLYGLTSVMALLTSFTADMLQSGPLLRSFGGGSIANGWAAFLAFVAAPALALAGALLARAADPWRIGLLAGLASVALFFLAFAALVVRHRLDACFRLLQEARGGARMSLLDRLRAMVVLNQRRGLQGVLRRLEVSRTGQESPDVGRGATMTTRGEWYIRLTRRPALRRLFVTLDAPTPLWTGEEVDGTGA